MMTSHVLEPKKFFPREHGRRGPQRIDLAGNIYGRLTAVRLAYVNRHRQSCWVCRCVCGNELVVTRNNLTSGTTKSCGCLFKETCKEKAAKINNRKGLQRTDLTGNVYGRLTVVGLAYTNRYRQSCWVCRCVCGNEHVVTRNNLTSGNTKSCGCLFKERGKVMNENV